MRLQVVGEFNAREKNNGCAGEKVEEVFMPAGKVDSVNESLIGKEVKLTMNYRETVLIL